MSRLPKNSGGVDLIGTRRNAFSAGVTVVNDFANFCWINVGISFQHFEY
jgi:hypothetical protein